MQITKSYNCYQFELSAKELAQMIIVTFFTRLLSNENIRNKPYDSEEVKEYINELVKYSVDSKEYEYYSALLDLYYAFERNCNFCFNLKRNFDPNKHRIKTIEDIEKFKDDPPDVIVKYKGLDYPFELKRYRGPVSFDDIYNFIKSNIVDHYAYKQNFLIILQPSNSPTIDIGIFKRIHEQLIGEKNQTGYIGLTFNHDSKEIITIRVLPKLEKYIRPYNHESDLFSELLHS